MAACFQLGELSLQTRLADESQLGMEGPWTTNPTKWASDLEVNRKQGQMRREFGLQDNEYFVMLLNRTWEKFTGATSFFLEESKASAGSRGIAGPSARPRWTLAMAREGGGCR